MPPQLINEYTFYPGHKETLSPVIFAKFGGPTEIEYFQHDHRFFGLILQLNSKDSVLIVPRWIRDIWFL